MKYQEIAGRVKYKDITKQCANKSYKYIILECRYDGIFIGLITWNATQELYMFYPSDVQLPYEVLMNLSEKIYTLMAERQLN